MNEKLLFLNVDRTTYFDLEDYNAELSLTETSTYESTFTTGTQIKGETQRFFQLNYIFVFMNQEEEAACQMRAIFDFASNSSSNKYSALQQIYNSSLTNRNVNFRRLKIRGKGRANQLQFISEDGKPFTILGWSIWETVNAGL